MSAVPRDSLETQLRERIFLPLARLRRGCRAYQALHGLARLVPAVMAGGLGQLALDRWLRLGVDQRIVISLALAGLWLGLAFRWLLRPLLSPLTDRWLAAAVDRAHAELGEQVATAVQFASGQVGRPAHHSPQLVRAVLKDACRAAADVSFLDVLDHRRAGRRALRLLAALLLIAPAVIFTPDTLATWYRRNWLVREVPWPQWTYIHPVGFDAAGRRRMPRGDELEISADIIGRTPRMATLHWETTAGRKGREAMTLVGGKRLQVSLGVLSEDVRFRIAGGDERTREFVVQAVERPAVVRTVARITPPAYTGLEPVTLEQQAVFELLAGSTLEIEARFNKGLRQAEFAGDDGAVGECELLAPDRVRVAWSDPRSGSYRFIVVGADGWENRRPVRYTLKVVPDQPPEVRMELPGVGAVVTAQAALTVKLQIKDTYGLGSAAFRVQRADAPPFTLDLEGFRPARRDFETTFAYAVAASGAVPGQRLRLWAEAADRDPRGPNRGRAAPLTLRVVTYDEFLDELANRELELRREFEHLLSAQRGLKDALERLLARLPRDSAAPAPLAQRLAGLARRQDAHAGRALALRGRFRQLLAEMRTSRVAHAAEERRIGDLIVAPLESLGVGALPEAAARIAELRQAAAAEQVQAVRAAQEEILRRMRAILAAMLKRAGYRETVALLKQVIAEQTEIRAATLHAVERELEAILELDGPGEQSPTDVPER